MNGYPSLETFRKDVGYLQNHVYQSYVPDSERIDRIDPFGEKGCEWTRLWHTLHGLDPTPIKEALILAYGHVSRFRPIDIASAHRILQRMETTTNTLRQCLALHHKDTQEDFSFPTKETWLAPTFDWIRNNDLQITANAKAPSIVPAIEKEFYSQLGKKEWSAETMAARYENHQLFGRLGKVNGRTVCYYICERVQGKLLRLLTWGVRDEQKAPFRAVPERMALDMLCMVTPNSHTSHAYEEITFAVDTEHPPLPVEPETSTNGRRYFL